MTFDAGDGGFRLRRFSDDFARILRERILAGELEAGSRLNEVQLSKEFGISRSPIREALQALAGEGLVTFVAGKGAFVGGITAQEARDLGAVREALETHAVGIVADRIDDAALAALEAVLAVDESGYADGGVGRIDFHATLLRLSGNERLEHAAMVVAAHLRLARSRSATQPGRVSDASGEHRLILEALRAGDRQGAIDAMRLHLQRATENACAALAAPGAR